MGEGKIQIALFPLPGVSAGELEGGGERPRAASPDPDPARAVANPNRLWRKCLYIQSRNILIPQDAVLKQRRNLRVTLRQHQVDLTHPATPAGHERTNVSSAQMIPRSTLDRNLVCTCSKNDRTAAKLCTVLSLVKIL